MFQIGSCHIPHASRGIMVSNGGGKGMSNTVDFFDLMQFHPMLVFILFLPVSSPCSHQNPCAYERL